ncbi:MAG: response regulator [Omnitrophica bacterium RIFCSPLOWO2_12_FULL_44_17]|uniref:Response regulator n=1 Tax=Candidatus Danuiimicrobium aquiferis TaxID=1801832 RepID=A0A1G1KV84_9BACT|nr:MAG: response regulator [Omnitrophica bacterium RIFCSPHIGHO2_02_FULL_45_28]OGW91737.1 MAG: response regulator [Omnitrophica bacterium RIFCSPHIGHO2_12_FULL_44_12]OGW96853.1 MAG: response regulator [Omnitrophica bacterium RIFCSPLOWO2_12_FULL_44_17]OGX02756.1 MAG: response regulator [Omnitrophica bacterium RIFCSPLOWO2_02_FULL_44_11]
MSNHNLKPIVILLVEDSLADIRLMEEILREDKFLYELQVVRDGEEAMRFLRRQEEFCNAPRPDLILLDLNLPKKDGREVLVEIKDDPDLQDIPVVILTTSDDEKDIYETYYRHANCYITKPVRLEKFISVVKHIEDFWFAVVKLPEKPHRSIFNLEEFKKGISSKKKKGFSL